MSWQAISGAHFNRVVMRLAALPSERFYGLGNQYSSFMHNGRSIVVMPTEPGIGKGSLVRHRGMAGKAGLSPELFDHRCVSLHLVSGSLKHTKVIIV